MHFKKHMKGLAAAALLGGAENAAASVDHVLLISIDGLHQSDLTWIQANQYQSTLPNLNFLINNGAIYSNATVPAPSGPYTGLLSLSTGGKPHTTGVYSFNGYSRALSPSGACSATGTTADFSSDADNTSNGQLLLDSGAGLNIYPVTPFEPTNVSAVPAGILGLALPGVASNAGGVQALLNSASLPADPGKNCAVVYPHEFLQVNTVFEVVSNHLGQAYATAWADDHPGYEILNGQSGSGVYDLFAPEINSLVSINGTADWTRQSITAQQFDSFKLKAVLNWIKGQDRKGNAITSGKAPALYGMSFHAAAAAQSLNFSCYDINQTACQSGSGYEGGYDISVTGKRKKQLTTVLPGSLLAEALSYIDQSIGLIVQEIQASGASTAIILTSRYGQSPLNRSNLTLINYDTLISGLNAAWNVQNPPLVAHGNKGNGLMLWLNYRNASALSFVKNYLNSYTSKHGGLGTDASGVKTVKGFTQSGLKTVLTGGAVTRYLQASGKDARVPDVLGLPQEGVIFVGAADFNQAQLTTIAAAGGNSAEDVNVPLIVTAVNAPQVLNTGVIETAVSATQVAPTILELLGIATTKANGLTAVRAEKTAVLPMLIK